MGSGDHSARGRRLATRCSLRGGTLPAVEVTARQAHWFRLRRSGLVDRFATHAETARHLVGVQAQMLPAANLALWHRTAGCTLDQLTAARLDDRHLVRMWGQRNTLHLYDSDDWPLLHVGLQRPATTLFDRLARDGGLTERDLSRHVRRTAKRLLERGMLRYTDVTVPALKRHIEHALATTKLATVINMDAGWMATHLIFRSLVRDGLACHGPDQGNESTFVHRESWLPALAWSPPDPETAGAELACRYLSTYGPAHARDVAHYFGLSLTMARDWITAAGGRCSAVVVEGQRRWCCRADLATLSEQPPPPSRWPVKLLYRFDPLLLGTKDKGWLVDAELKRKVWIRAAHVNAVLLVRGRIAGIWRYDRKSQGLHVKVEPFFPLSSSVARATRTQAAAIAKFLKLPLRSLEIEPNQF